MIVITRNGKTTVYTGWQAWLVGAIALIGLWLAFLFFAALFVGVALSVSLALLLLVPALALVAFIGNMMRGPSR